MHVRYFMEYAADIIGYTLILGAYAVYRNWLRTKDLETQLVSARLETLSHQLQPHFLFNALNAVSAAIYEDRARADRMLEGICDFLRATLRLPDSPVVPVSTELSLVRQYLGVIKTRLEDRLQFEIRCDHKTERAQVPALLLQPLVENAVEHGQNPESGCLDISVEARSTDDGFVIFTIRDHGPGVNGGANGASNGAGHGLLNARKRLRAAYGDRAGLALNAHPGGGAIVEIRIPA
jgi:sensor histidine kinase YesM